MQDKSLKVILVSTKQGKENCEGLIMKYEVDPQYMREKKKKRIKNAIPANAFIALLHHIHRKMMQLDSTSLQKIMEVN